MSLTIHTDVRTTTVDARPGERLTEAAFSAGIALNTRCAGNGTCGGCTVNLGPGRYRINGEEVHVRDGEHQVALACQTEILNETAAVTFPRTSVLEREAVIDEDFSLPHLALRISDELPPPFAEASGGYGLAVDIGTTTVAVLLVDLHSRKVLAKASMYNQQIRKADDVASRISYCQREQDVTTLQRLLIDETVNPLLSTVCAEIRLDPGSVTRVAVSGNTVMTHLCWGLSPVSIGTLPFTPVTRRYNPQSAQQLGLNAAPAAVVEAVPSIAGYVGGDIVSDCYLVGMQSPCEATLMIDVGTNGEMVFRDGDRMAACATAAGPAFEGYGLSHGCRAAAGTIERIEFTDPLHMEWCLIGRGRPVGVCGSAIIDFMACAFRSGLINQMGRYHDARLRASGRALEDLSVCGGSKACIIVPAGETAVDGPIFVTERDIEQVLKAKAAIYAGLSAMLHTLEVRAIDLKRIYLAGGFARHISLPHAIVLGLFPDIPLENYEIVGNGSLAGAYLALTDSAAPQVYETLIDQPRVIELNQIHCFESLFIDALAIPNMEMSLFPSVSTGSLLKSVIFAP